MEFLDTFEDCRGSGEGYPEDGSPVLTGDYVTDYAERADGDEDYAESWTTYVMLDSLPERTEDEPLALQKVRWFEGKSGMAELREAIRNGGLSAPAPPRLRDRLPPIEVPSWLHGT